MSMKRTTVDGKTVNQRTADMLAMWQFNSLRDFYVVQGSYNAGGVSASAGTHDGGGAVDLSVYGLGTTADKKWHVKQGRLAGFAAWYRPTLPGEWNEHIHAIAIGDGEMSSGAASQVRDYYAGRNGLASHAADPDPRVSPIPVWPHRPLKRINGLVAYRQFKKKKPNRRTTVKRIQWVLNEKLGTHLVCDGVAGPQTRAAYKAWEKKIGSHLQDGIPGKVSLDRLGVGRFKVSWASFEKWREDHKVTKREQADHEAKHPTFHKK